MDSLFLLITLAGIGAIFYYKKKDKQKRNISIAVAIVGFILFGLTSPADAEIQSQTSQNEEASSEPVESSVLDSESESIAESESKAESESYAALMSSANGEWEKKLDNPRTDVTYENLMRTPDDYTGEIIELSGTILQTMKSDGEVQHRVALYDNYDTVALIAYDENLPETRILDDDYVTFTGTSSGTITYETVLGSELEIPAIYVERIGL